MAEEFPDQFKDAKVQVKVLAPERTFWEKVTLMHSENGRPKEKAFPPRLSRHYSDVAMIYPSDVGKRAIENIKLLEEVVKHKRVFFPSSWANYDAAKPGSLLLTPNADLEKALRADYGQMKDMFFGAPESFESVLALIGEMESVVNEVAA